MTAFRNGLAALVAVALLLVVGRALAPALAANLPDKDAVSAVLGLTACLLTVLYKLLDGVLAAFRLGARPPALSRWVSILAGASVLALIGGAFAFAATAAVQQAVPMLRASPGVAATVGGSLLHLDLLRTLAELVAALLIGSWIGRRHGRPMLAPVAAFALLATAGILAVQALSGLADAGAIVEGLRRLIQAPSLAAAQATPLPLLAGLFVAALLGAWLGGGARSRHRDLRPLTLAG